MNMGWFQRRLEFSWSHSSQQVYITARKQGNNERRTPAKNTVDVPHFRRMELWFLTRRGRCISGKQMNISRSVQGGARYSFLTCPRADLPGNCFLTGRVTVVCDSCAQMSNLQYYALRLRSSSDEIISTRVHRVSLLVSIWEDETRPSWKKLSSHFLFVLTFHSARREEGCWWRIQDYL